MTKLNKVWIIAIVILLVVMMQGKKEIKKEATTGLEATRVFDSYIVAPGGTVTATYDNIAAGYMGVIEDPPTGWTSSPVPESPDGRVRFTSDYGTDFIMTWTAPATLGDYTFIGEYFVSPDITWTSLDTDVITVISPSCTPATEDIDCSTDTECRNYYCDVDTCASTDISGSCDAGAGTCQSGECIPAECTPDWTCTSWIPAVCPSSCSQTSICTDSNECGTTAGKPAETQSCSGGDCNGVTCNCDTYIPLGCGIGANEGQRRFTRACTPSACDTEEQYVTDSTCAVTDTCEVYQTEDETTGECKTAGWVYLIIIGMAFFMFLKVI